MKRDTRSMWELKQAHPTYMQIVEADVVDINTNEAKTLFKDDAIVLKSWTIHGRKAQAYWHGGKQHLWIAGVTSNSPDDDYPISEEEIEERRQQQLPLVPDPTQNA